MLFNFGTSRNTRYIGHELPPQFLPTKQKTEDWAKDCMDALENIGVRQISVNAQKYYEAFKVLEGSFSYRDVMKSSLFLSEVDYWRSQSKIPKQLDHYGFVESIVNFMIGHFLKTPNPITIVAEDSLSVNDYIDMKTDLLWGEVNKDIEKRLTTKLIKNGIDPFQEEFESEEEKQQYLQSIQEFKLQNTPPEIEKFMNQSWRAVYIEWAEQTLKEDYTRFDIDEIDKKCLYEYLATGKCFKHYRAGYDYYQVEHWSLKNTFYDDSVENIEEGDYGGRIMNLSANKVISLWGHLLSEEEKRDISKAGNYERHTRSGSSNIYSLEGWVEQGMGNLEFHPHPSYSAYRNAKYIQEETDMDLGMPDEFPHETGIGAVVDIYNQSLRTDLIRCIEGYWVSQKKIGYLTLYNELIGEIETEIVTDEILPAFLKDRGVKQIKTVSLQQHELNPEPNTIVWDYVPEVWWGLKILKHNTDLPDDLYKGLEPLPYQLKGESQNYHTKLPIVGLNHENSLVSRFEVEQRDYNVAMNMAKDYMTKELGVFYLMDFSYLPTWIKDLGGEESFTKLMDVVRELGILPVEGEHARSSFNQFSAVNMDLTQAMLGKVQYAQMIKRTAFEKLGFTPELLGTPQQETATGVQQATQSGLNQIETWIDTFTKFQKRSAEVHVNFAQYVKKDGKDGSFLFTDSDKVKKFINMSDPYLPLRRFRILFENDSKSRINLEMLKQVYFNDNTIAKDLESMAEVMNAGSMGKILQHARIGRKIAQIEQQKQQEYTLAQIEMQEAKITERKEMELAWTARENALDRQKDIYKQQILALGFDKEKDANNNGVPDVMEQTELAIKILSANNAQIQQEADQILKRDEVNAKMDIENKHIDLEKEKLNLERYKIDRAFDIARENKTQHELKAKKK